MQVEWLGSPQLRLMAVTQQDRILLHLACPDAGDARFVAVAPSGSDATGPLSRGGILELDSKRCYQEFGSTRFERNGASLPPGPRIGPITGRQFPYLLRVVEWCAGLVFARVHHRNGTGLGVWADEHYTYFATEFAKNGELFEMVAVKPVSEPEVRIYTYEVFQAMKWMHDRGLDAQHQFGEHPAG